MRFSLTLVASCALSTAACSEPVRGPAPTVSSSAEDLAFDSARFDSAAKAFVAAALTYAETCDIEAKCVRGYSYDAAFDVCSTSPKDGAPVLSAGDTLAAATTADRAMPQRAAEVSYRAAIFREWVDSVMTIKVSRGTMKLYQELALAYDAYKSDEKVPSVPSRALEQYFVKHPKVEVDYFWSQNRAFDAPRSHPFTTYDARREKGTPLVWKDGAQGPFLED